MKKSLLVAVMASTGIFSFTATNALADDGKINFIGSITDTACTVVNTPSNPLTVTLGTVSRTSLDGGAGKTAAPTGFKINLTDCPASLNGHTASVKFDGVSANSDNSALKLTQDTGVATGVGIQITDNTGAVVPLYTPSSAYSLVTGDNSLDFVARYLSVASTVTAGPANSTSNFTIVYN
ncbi:fimbrial protein [Klebsiella sp. KE9767]|uniref:fimbrial protein n=1 Tax=Klebsiella sp. KE9767 TaxID=3118151 RepID=UPI003750942E